MWDRIVTDTKVRSTGWAFVIAVIVAAGGGLVSDDVAGRLLEGLILTLPTALMALGIGWKGGKTVGQLPPPPGEADHG